LLDGWGGVEEENSERRSIARASPNVFLSSSKTSTLTEAMNVLSREEMLLKEV